MTGAELDLAVVVLGGYGVHRVWRGARRKMPRGRRHLDPVRLFSSEQRREIFARAGGRCEHFNLLGMRCRRAPQHADHVYPHSKGGATSLVNAQALCAWHNERKGAKVPSRLAVARLEHRRRSYFPPGTAVEVRKHPPRARQATTRW